MKNFTFKSIATATAVIASLFAMNTVEVYAQEAGETVQADALYIMGSATAVDFNIDNPIALDRSAGEENVFVYKGELTPGEIKLTTEKGNWDAPFIRPVINGSEIGTTPIVDEKYQVTIGGSEDYKWRITTHGIYTLTFNLSNGTMSSTYDGNVPPVEKGSVNPENVYLLGAASPSGWDINNPAPMQKISDYHFVYEGPLNEGVLKFCMEKGNWCSPCVRPLTDNDAISLSGAASPDFTVARYPDNAWNVTEAKDNYRIELDFETFTIVVSAFDTSAKNPIETETVYMLGNATQAGWNIENIVPLQKSHDNPYIFTYTGNLKPGELRFCLTQGSWNVPMLRPTEDSSEIGTSDFYDEPFEFRTGGDDTNWKVSAYGKYTISLNLKDWTISSKYDNLEWPEVNPIIAENVYILGDAAPCGWDIYHPTALTSAGENIFVYDGELKTGKLEAMTTIGDWSAKFIRPLTDGEIINQNGVASDKFTYTSTTDYPDYMWNVEEVGNYRVTLNLNDWTIKVEKSTTTGIDGIGCDNVETITVVNINGQVLLDKAAPSEMSKLPKGFYIVNGKKVIKNF